MSIDDDEAQKMASIVQRMLTAGEGAPTRTADWVSEQGRFAAREFLARWIRETGEDPSAVITDRILFAYEMGYLRGHGEGIRTSMALYDETKRKVNDADPK
jgi:hypothetical protein